MTEKVKVTKEQAEAIERYKKELVDSIDEQYRFGVKRTPYEWAEPLVELGGEQVLEIIKHGYEVEPEFEVGDWVVRTKELNHQNFHEGKIFKVKRIVKGHLTKDLLVVDNDDNSEHHFENIRHATSEEIAKEKQRRWWAKHDRKVWELKINDE